MLIDGIAETINDKPDEEWPVVYHRLSHRAPAITIDEELII
jgi:hypothetical protein